jgi:hypothetical protein
MVNMGDDGEVADVGEVGHLAGCGKRKRAAP